jgi:DNA-binding transcriptional MocR family regulator
MKRDKLTEMFESVGVKVHVPQGGYFLILEVEGETGVEFCDRLIKKGVGVLPLKYFYHDQVSLGSHLVRAVYCKSEETLARVAEVLHS